MNNIKVLLITTDNHTLGIQTVANIIYKKTHILPEMFYLPFNLLKYPCLIEKRILHQIFAEIDKFEGKVLVGFSLKEMSLQRSLQLASNIKRYRCEKTKLVAGGTYTIAEPSSLLSLFDYVVIGAGDGILNVIDAVILGKDINPIIVSLPKCFEYPLFRESWVLNENGEIIQKRLRLLIHPQYKFSESLEVMAGVGCSYSCSYCEVAALRNIFSGKYRINFADPEGIIRLLEKELEQNPKVNYIYFFDEDFLLKPYRWIKRFSLLYSKNIELPFFIFATPFSVMKYSEKVLTLIQAGLDTINIGIQSGSERIAKHLFGRKESGEEIRDCVYFLTELYTNGKMTSPPMLDFIILNPFEKTEEILDTIHMIMELPTPFNAIMHCMSFFRGTPLYTKARNEGIIPESYQFQYDLHDFMSRVITNELQIDYTKRESIQWLFLNTLLYGMRGIHQQVNGVRYYGHFDEMQLNNLLSSYYNNISYDDVISLASSLPDPMNTCYPIVENIHELYKSKMIGNTITPTLSKKY